MRVYRLGDLSVLQQGTLGTATSSTYGAGSYGGAVYGAQDAVVADILFDAANGQPALIPAPQWSTATWLATSDSRFSFGGTWSGAATVTPGSSLTLTFWGYGAIVYLTTGSLAGIAWVTMDGAPYLAIDSYLAQEGPLDPVGGGSVAALTLIAPTGGQHVVVLTYYGDINAAVAPIGTPANTVGTTVAGLLLPARANRGATTTATWTVQAVDSTHVSIDGSGSYALGTTVTGVVNGVSLALASGTLGILAAPAQPAPITATSGGTVLAGTYGVEVSYVNAAGETTASASGSVTTTGSTSTITVPSPAASGNATGWYAYVTQAGGSTATRQQAPGSPTALGTGLTLTAPPTASGANPPASNTSGDTATFTTAATGITLAGAYVAPYQASGGSYTTTVVASDGSLPLSGDVLPLAEPGADRAAIRWLAATWEEDPAYPVTAGAAATGNTLNPSDAAWATAPAADGFDPAMLAISHDGAGTGVMGLAVLPRGCYCQLTIDPPAAGYVRNLRLYGWQPETDPDARRFPAVPGRQTNDDLAQRLYGALAVGWALTEREPMRELLASASLGAAVGGYLDLHGSDWDLPRPFGMADGTYAALLRYLAAARTNGGTLAFYQRALALVLGPNARYNLTSLAGTTTTWVLGTSHLGTDTAIGSFTPNAWQAQLAVSVSTLTIPPQVLQVIAELFRPIGVDLIYLWQ